MKTKGGKTRWSANCRAALMLKVGLKKGTIDPNANPKTVYLSKPEYQRYPLANFRAGLNRIKAELGVHVRGGGNEDGPTMLPLTPEEQEIYDEENAEDTEEPDKKPAASTSTSNSAAAVAASAARVNNPSDTHPADATCMNHLYEWMPIYAISLWKNGDMDEQVTLAILLPSGVGSIEDSQVRVDDNLYEVHVRVKWPTIASVVSSLHSLWNLPEYHPKLVGFHDFFSNLRERESDSLYSEATIGLPMRVQKTPVEFHRLGDRSGARVLYVTYRAVQKNDYKGIEDTDFVMVGDDQSKVTP